MPRDRPNRTAIAAHPILRLDPQQLFHEGEAALKKNNLDAAEHSFRGVLAVDPQAGAAYANLGVISMRRKQWPQALDMLQKAEHLMPQVPGIRLNLGLVYYRQNQFRAAIAPFESVVHDAPDSYQARYLLGLCYFFTERYADATTMLEPLWQQASNQLNYLYVLGIAAGKSSRARSRAARTGPPDRKGTGLSRTASARWAKPTSIVKNMMTPSRNLNSRPKAIPNFPSFISILEPLISRSRTCSEPKKNFSKMPRSSRMLPTTMINWGW